MKLDKLNKKMEKQFVNDAKELIAIMQDQFGSEKDFDVIKSYLHSKRRRTLYRNEFTV